MKVANAQYVVISLIALFFFACGSDSGNGAEVDTTAEVKTIHGLGDCKGANEGVTKLVLSENRYYTCEDGEWSVSGSFIDTVKTEDDLPACLSRRDGDSVYVMSEKSVFYCQDGAWESRGLSMGQYETKSKLPECEKDIEGFQGFVKKDSTVYVCDGEAWEAWAEFDGMSGRDIDKDPKSSDSAEQSGDRSSESKSSSSVEKAGSSPSSSGETTISGSSNDEGGSDSSSSEEDSSDSESSSSVLWESSSDGSVYDASANTLTDLRDGQVYRTIVVTPAGSSNSLVWMAENLNYKASESYCMNDDVKNCEKQGRLYTWSVASTVCPEGWGLPALTDWQKLYAAAGSSYSALWSKSYYSGTDKIGFGGVPTGVWDSNRSSQGYISTKNGFWWSSTKNGSSSYKTFELYETSINYGYYSPKSRLAVRCVMLLE